MSILESIKNILIVPDDDELENELEDVAEASETRKKSEQSENFAAKKTESTPRIIGGGKSKAVTMPSSQMQVVLVKPDRYDDVTAIADHMNEKKTVVLNLEAANKELARRIVDFLSGATYANHGNMRKVSRGTFLIVPNGVDMMGEVMIEDFEESGMYF